MTNKISPLFAVLILALGFQSCKTDTVDPFLIGNQHIGLLTDSTQVKDLKAIYINDSISTYQSDDSFTGLVNNIHILDKTGKHLLTLSPTEVMDSTATISTVKIEDGRYATDKGININSTYGELSAAYTIKKIDNLINTIVVSVEESDAAFTIDKKELPANMRFDMNLNIDPIQIPDNAKIKYFMIHW